MRNRACFFLATLPLLIGCSNKVCTNEGLNDNSVITITGFNYSTYIQEAVDFTNYDADDPDLIRPIRFSSKIDGLRFSPVYIDILFFVIFDKEYKDNKVIMATLSTKLDEKGNGEMSYSLLSILSYFEPESYRLGISAFRKISYPKDANYASYYIKVDQDPSITVEYEGVSFVY